MEEVWKQSRINCRRMFPDTLSCGTCIAAGFSLGLLSTLVIRKWHLVPVKMKFILPEVYEVKMVLVARTDLGMTKGKIAAQCAHAAVSCYKEAAHTCPSILAAWELRGSTKVVCRSESEVRILALAQQAKDLGLISSVIRDAGLTQIEHGSVTVVGIGPGSAELIDRVTGNLKLL